MGINNNFTACKRLFFTFFTAIKRKSYDASLWSRNGRFPCSKIYNIFWLKKIHLFFTGSSFSFTDPKNIFMHSNVFGTASAFDALKKNGSNILADDDFFEDLYSMANRSRQSSQ